MVVAKGKGGKGKKGYPSRVPEKAAHSKFSTLQVGDVLEVEVTPAGSRKVESA